jgi:N-acetylglucosamine-6-phosphate deacetylase
MQIEFPGFFDLQANGFGGVDFNNPLTTPEELHSTVEQLCGRGMTRFPHQLMRSRFDFSLAHSRIRRVCF